MSSKSKTKTERATELLSLDAALELIQDRRKLFWLNFKAGFVRGFAGALGAVIALVIIGYLVSNLGGVPIIGDFVKDIGEAAQTAQ
ncbi:MAG: hypothetical protein E6Q36_01075 [Chryseobacterium sp.]|nr:MAG: hypothetical protein E6Q36_01075 [Chryseobacterium sp.]